MKTISSKRPYNARYDAKWQILDEGDIVKNLTGRSEKHLLNSKSTISLYHHDIDAKVTKLNIRVDWSNMHKNWATDYCHCKIQN